MSLATAEVAPPGSPSAAVGKETAEKPLFRLANRYGPLTLRPGTRS